MSYDTYVHGPCCETCNHSVSVDVGNYTYNVGPMFFKALSFAAKKEMGFCDLDDMSVKKGPPILKRALKHMQSNPDEYRPLNPENGWGNYPGAMQYLKSLIEACISQPKGTIEVS